jgi:hypothetical protein
VGSEDFDPVYGTIDDDEWAERVEEDDLSGADAGMLLECRKAGRFNEDTPEEEE